MAHIEMLKVEGILLKTAIECLGVYQAHNNFGGHSNGEEILLLCCDVELGVGEVFADHPFNGMLCWTDGWGFLMGCKHSIFLASFPMLSIVSR